MHINEKKKNLHKSEEKPIINKLWIPSTLIFNSLTPKKSPNKYNQKRNIKKIKKSINIKKVLKDY